MAGKSPFFFTPGIREVVLCTLFRFYEPVELTVLINFQLATNARFQKEGLENM